MPRTVSVRAESFPLARPFAISRGVKTAADVVVVEISEGDRCGWAECVPYPRYGETVESVIAQIEAAVPDLAGGADRDSINAQMPAGAARNAVDCALWDLAAKLQGESVATLAGLGPLNAEITAETIGIGTPEEMGARAKELHAAPLLKVKLDSKDVQARLEAVRENAPNARMIVDPNEGWDVTMLSGLLPFLSQVGVEMLEQPVPADFDSGLADLVSPVPICADESVHTADDLAALRDRYDMVNIKLDKTGGLTEALRLKQKALDLGFGIMVGCMVGTSLGMAPAVLVAQGAKIIDLDGPLLLREDRVDGLSFGNGKVSPPSPALWG